MERNRIRLSVDTKRCASYSVMRYRQLTITLDTSIESVAHFCLHMSISCAQTLDSSSQIDRTLRFFGYDKMDRLQFYMGRA